VSKKSIIDLHRASACFSRYLKNLTDIAQQGDAREESFYPALADMLKKMADATDRPMIRRKIW